MSCCSIQTTVKIVLMVSLNHREFNLISWHRYISDNYQKQLERRNVPLLLRISLTTNHSNIMITTKPRITPGSHIIFLEESEGKILQNPANVARLSVESTCLGRPSLPRNYRKIRYPIFGWSHGLTSFLTSHCVCFFFFLCLLCNY